MTYFEDLTPYSYFFNESLFCGLPVLNVGWQQFPHPLPVGETPSGFADRLFGFCARDKLVSLMGGHQDCYYCGATWAQQLKELHTPLGNGEIRVLGEQVVYAAPSLIYHYVAAHGYCPPPEFVAAVMTGPAPDSQAMRAYRFRIYDWQSAITLAQKAGKAIPPDRKPRSVLRPLILKLRVRACLRYLYWALGTVWLLNSVPALFLPSGLAVLVLLSRYAHRLPCPFCARQMAVLDGGALPWQPVTHQYTIYCARCEVALEPTLGLFEPLMGDVSTGWL